ncbi:HAD family phosphatase [Aerococcaceae bacterium DSM 111020]|nr:HAD family phosphatase [Aerococcaceae bacterium DSM 111020]
MIKLFVSDMDGTLLNGQHVISSANAQAIRDLENAGIEFLIATGRSHNSAAPLLKMHDLSAKMITLNGATFNEKDGSIKYTHTLTSSDINEMVQYAQEHQLDYSIMTPEDYYLKDYQQFIDRIEAHMQLSQSNLDDQSSTSQFIVDTSFVHPVEEYVPNAELPICKIMILSTDEEAKQAFINQFNHYPDLDITSSAPDNLEITSNKAQKGLALEDYATEKGYSINEIATIGDSLNDRSMLQMAHYSFAMDNASEQVKSLANYQAPHHDEDGVAKVIYDILEGKYNE